MPYKNKKYLPLLLLPIIIILCFGLWSAEQSPLPWTRVESDTAVFDARDIDFSQYIVSFNRCVEYVPDVMLTPEEFERHENIMVGKVPDETDVCTMRIRILVSDYRMYGIAGYSVNYASSVYINGKWLFDEGKPGYTLETEESSEAYRVFSATPEKGVIEIVVQTSSFANIDTSSAMGWCIGDYESLRLHAARKTTIDVIIMAWYILLAIVALLLFLMLPKYRANGWLALLAMTWAIRTGLKNTKFLLTLFPNHTWSFVYKIEIMTSFVTIIFLAFIINSVFPKYLPKWFQAIITGGNILAIFYIIIMPWQTFLGHSSITNPIIYWILGLLYVIVFISKCMRKEKFTLAQMVHFAGAGLILFAFIWDQGYFKYELFPWSLTQPMMLVFIMFMLVAAMLTTMQKTTEREVELVQKVELQEKEIIKTELELLESRTSIMLSQIQPHFLYNSLTAIGELCEIDTRRAKDAVYNFADYLRGNLESLGKRELIPFADELTHVETYLALEQLRFGEKLHMVYDIETENFMLPPLTVQPIAENAVRYGLAKKKPDGTMGGTVTVSTKELEDAHQITVTDDGVGFDQTQSKTDGREHIGIENARGRLAALCNGRLEIKSTPGLGTTVVITIPKNYGRDDRNS